MSSLPPDLRYGTLNVLVLLLSCVPNEWARRAARQHDLGGVRVALVLCMLFAVAFVALRVLEFTTLNCRWDANAYGSIVWTLLGLHALHLVTESYDTGVLTALTLTETMDGKRFVDVGESAEYWYFVVLTWLPIYAVAYWASRLV
jgi:heme/copper-type cytochrome/quinol oxidase subunit 3